MESSLAAFLLSSFFCLLGISIIAFCLYSIIKEYRKDETIFNNNIIWFALGGIFISVFLIMGTFIIKGKIEKYDNELYRISKSNNIESNIINDDIDYQGTIGDLFGGIYGPIVGLIGAVLAGMAFYAQYKANEEITRQFKIQQFENQYFKLIDLYRKNADEIKINSFSNRKCFAVMYEEFRFIYSEVEDYLSSYELNEKDLTSISYCIFYYGVGNNILKILDKNFKYLHVNFDELYTRLNLVKTEFEYSGEVILINDYGQSISYVFKYSPFKGHLSRLGHYYRHLFQTVKFVITEKNLKYEEKYSYLKILRAQLSDYELIFLFFNSLFEKGKEWFDYDIFDEYRFLKNIPLELINIGLNPNEIIKPFNSRGEKNFD